MRKFYFFICFFVFYCQAYAQTVKNIKPADVSTKSLNQIIAEDIAGKDSSFHIIYRLDGNFPYLLRAEVNFTNVHLQIEAANSNQIKPLLLFGVASGGQTINQLFRLNGKAQLTLKGLILSGQTDQGTTTQSIVRTSGANKLTIDNCVIDNVGQSAFRINGNGEEIIIRNSTFNRLGQLTNPDNGRFIDNRSPKVVSCTVENCLVSNVTSRFWRTDGAAGPVDKIFMKNNTFYNSGQAGFEFGRVADLTFINNIVVNAMYLGRVLDPDTNRMRPILTISQFTPNTTKVKIENNNFFVSDSVKLLTPGLDNRNRKIVSSEGFEFDSLLRANFSNIKVVNFRENLKFTKEPIVPLAAIRTANLDINSGNQRPNAGVWSVTNLTEVPIYSGTNLGSTIPIPRFEKFYEYCYSSQTKSATATAEKKSIGGGLGSCSMLTNAERYTLSNMANFYPNPVSDFLFIDIKEKSTNGHSLLKIYSASGVLMFENQIRDSNSEINISNLPNGLYQVSLIQNNNMQLFKFLKI